MSKQKKTADDSFFADLAKDTGGRLLKGLGDSKYFIDAGNLALNYICSGKFIGGGAPTGVTEAYGPPSSSKSLLGYTLLGSCQRMGGYAILLDCERSANEFFAVTAGHVDENKLIVQTPRFMEEVETKIVSMTTAIRKAKGKDTPILFVWDSISVALCEREWRETKLPDNYTQADFKRIVGAKEQPGERAKAAGKVLRKVNPFLDDNNASLFIINQTRQTIGVMYGDPEVTGGGGKALPFYANCRLRLSASKFIEDKKRKMPIGVNVKMQNKKSRSFVPFISTTGVQLYFSSGINPLGGLLSILIAAERIEADGKGYFKLLEPWSGGKNDARFQSTLERNDVPASILYEFPALVDAESEEQVKSYLATYGKAIDISTSDATEDKKAEDDFDIAEKLGVGEDKDEEE